MSRPQCPITTLVVAAICFSSITLIVCADEPKPRVECLGLTGIKNVRFDKYLQSYVGGDKEGQLHCSNPKRHSEETWVLWKLNVDKENKHLYAVQNCENKKFLSIKPETGCAKADAPQVGKNEVWVFETNKNYGFEAPDNVFAIRSSVTGHYLGTRQPGDDIPACGGEVGCGAGASKPVPPTNGDQGYVGWWRLEPAQDYQRYRPLEIDLGKAAGAAAKIAALVLPLL